MSNRNLVNLTIMGIDEYEKDLESVAHKETINGLKNLEAWHFLDHIYESVGHINPEQIQGEEVSDVKIILYTEGSNDGRCHHFYFGFNWNEDTHQYDVRYLHHQAFTLEYDEKTSIRYLGFDDLKSDIEKLFSPKLIMSLEVIKETCLESLEKLRDGQQFQGIRLFLGEEEMKDGVARNLIFDFQKGERRDLEVCYRGYEKG